MSPYYLIYDWNCELCTRLMKFIKRLDRKDAIVFVPLDDPMARELCPGMDEEAFRGSFHFVLPDGRRTSGDEAIPYVLGALPGGKMPQWILEHFPGRRWLLKAFYRWVAKSR